MFSILSQKCEMLRKAFFSSSIYPKKALKENIFLVKSFFISLPVLDFTSAVQIYTLQGKFNATH